MALEDVLISSTETINDLTMKLGSIGRWIQALILMMVLWVLIQIVNFIIAAKSVKNPVLKTGSKELKKINKSLDSWS